MEEIVRESKLTWSGWSLFLPCCVTSKPTFYKHGKTSFYFKLMSSS
jgi:hypothetical protein